ncbi:TetR/AcrR family transcriptional regulator [Nocardioides xinjiangensis]|uniref:TetR/AcrR family transcriptional regulator n=1 Tax=Nocardioides xinjiangensis TaxID=2817376 RepID=UPI001B30B8A4|nr:TetR family transcriptional regulator [Nocardioides sp. SYSU D00778]
MALRFETQAREAEQWACHNVGVPGGYRLPHQGSAKGDDRRARLLAALENVLRENGGDLDRVQVSDVASRAGVSRSAFYFYFDDKAEAAADAFDWYVTIRPVTAVTEVTDPRARIETMIANLLADWRPHQHLFRAVLQARHTSKVVRDRTEAARASYTAVVADWIRQEQHRATGSAGPDAEALAVALNDMSERMLERMTLDQASDATALAAAVTEVWVRTIYTASSIG